MTFEYFIAYFFILFIATIIPGPNSLLAVNHGVNHGLERTLFSGLGNLTGNLLMALLSILGLGAILLASGIVFTIIKWIGIIYLVYVGLKLIVEPVRNEMTGNNNEKALITKGRGKLFIDGFVIAVGNPKGILFFTALFPQFINLKSATAGDFLIVFLTLGVVAFGCYMLYATFGMRLNKLFQIPSFRKKVNVISGSVFIGTGLALALSKK